MKKKAVFKNTAEDRTPLVIPIHIGYGNSLVRFLVDLFVSSFLLIIRSANVSILGVPGNDEASSNNNQ